MPNVILEESGSPAPFGTPYPGATAGAAVAANIANSMANAKKAVAEAKMRQALAEAVGRGELVEENGQLYETGKQPSAQRQAALPAAQAPQGVPMPSLDWRSGFPAGQNTADVQMRGLEEAANIRGMTVGELVRDQRRQAQLQKQAQDAALALKERFTGGLSLDLPGLVLSQRLPDLSGPGFQGMPVPEGHDATIGSILTGLLGANLADPLYEEIAGEPLPDTLLGDIARNLTSPWTALGLTGLGRAGVGNLLGRGPLTATQAIGGEAAAAVAQPLASRGAEKVGLPGELGMAAALPAYLLGAATAPGVARGLERGAIGLSQAYETSACSGLQTAGLGGAFKRPRPANALSQSEQAALRRSKEAVAKAEGRRIAQTFDAERVLAGRDIPTTRLEPGDLGLAPAEDLGIQRSVFEDAMAGTKAPKAKAQYQEQIGRLKAQEEVAGALESKPLADAVDAFAGKVARFNKPANAFNRGYQEELTRLHGDLTTALDRAADLPAGRVSNRDLFGAEVYTSPRGENARLESQAGLGVGSGERSVSELPMFKPATAPVPAKGAGEAIPRSPPAVAARGAKAAAGAVSPPAAAAPPPRKPPTGTGDSFEEARGALLKAAREEENLRRVGTVEREIKAGRRGQAARIRASAETGGTAAERQAAARQAAYAGGTLRETFIKPLQLEQRHLDAVMDEAVRMLDSGEMGDFDYLRLVMPESERRRPGILARLMSDQPTLQPKEIEFIRRFFGDEVAELVARRSADTVPTPAALLKADAKEIADTRRYLESIERRQSQAAAKALHEEQAANWKTVRTQEQLDKAVAAGRKAQADNLAAELARAQRIAGDMDQRLQSRRFGLGLEAETTLKRTAQIKYKLGVRTAEELTAKAEAMAMKAGINPEHITPVLNYWRQGTEIEIAALADSNMLTTHLRALEATWTGDLADSAVNKAIHSGAYLKKALLADGYTDEVANAIVKAEVKRLTHGAGPELAAHIDKIMRGPIGETDVQGIGSRLVQRWKNTKFGTIDVGWFGVNMLASVARGGIAQATGLLNRLSAHIRSPIFNAYMDEVMLPKRLRNILDGVHVGLGPSPVRAELGTMFQYLGPPGRLIDNKIVIPYTEALNELQFGRALQYVRDLTHEGNLVLAHFAGLDVENPLVRRTVARNANAITQFADSALNLGRRNVEANIFTSSAYTRAQFQIIGELTRVLNPTSAASGTERLIAAQMILSTIGTVALVGKVINDQIGMGEFEFDPSKPGAYTITFKNPVTGKPQVIDLFPQDAVQNALARSTAALAEGDEQRAAEMWARMALGRTGTPPGQIGAASLGMGFEPGKGFTLGPIFGDKPLSLKARLNMAPFPPVIQSVIEKEGTDPFSSGLTTAGITTYPESQYAGEDRFAKEIFGKGYRDLATIDQASVHQAMDEAGIPVEDWRRLGPFWDADDKAYAELRAEGLAPEVIAMLNGANLPVPADYEDLDDFEDAAIKEFKRQGAKTQEAKDALTKMKEAIGLASKALAEQKWVISKDPRLVGAMQRQYDKGELTFPPSKALIDLAEELQMGSSR